MSHIVVPVSSQYFGAEFGATTPGGTPTVSFATLYLVVDTTGPSVVAGCTGETNANAIASALG